MQQDIRIMECTSPNCCFRIPVEGDPLRFDFCPKCGSHTRLYTFKHQNKKSGLFTHKIVTQREIVVVLDNIRSMYNTGSIFRTADGFGIKKLFLCGITPTPNQKKLHKTSLGSESNLLWEYQNNCVILCQRLLKEGYQLLCLENSDSASVILDFSISSNDRKIAVIVGNEKSGVDPGVLKICNQVISIPMAGIKESFNVTVALGIMLYHLISSR